MSKYTQEIDICIKSIQKILKATKKHKVKDYHDDLMDIFDYLFEFCEGENRLILDRLVRNDKQYFRVDYQSPETRYRKKKHAILRNAPCLYPRQTIIQVPLSISGLSHATQIETCLQNFCDIYATYRTCLDAGLAQLYLSDFQNTLDHELNNLTRNRNVCKIRSNNAQDNSEKYLVAHAPWLEYATPEDYVNIIYKNDALYKKYLRHIDKLACAVKNEVSLTRETLLGYVDSYIEINAELQVAQENLKRKAKSCSIGVIATGVALAFDLPDMLQTLIGTIPASYMLSTLDNEIVKVQDVGKSNANWVIWSWHRKAIKRKKKARSNNQRR